MLSITEQRAINEYYNKGSLIFQIRRQKKLSHEHTIVLTWKC